MAKQLSATKLSKPAKIVADPDHDDAPSSQAAVSALRPDYTQGSAAKGPSPYDQPMIGNGMGAAFNPKRS